MNESRLRQQFHDAVARRLLEKALPLTHPRDQLSRLPALPDSAQSSPTFVKIEKNLASLGFFTPSNKRINGHHKKTITFTRVIEGRKVIARTTILGSPELGLPITADQDKYLALHRIVNDIKQSAGRVTNPVVFTSTELLELLEQTHAGKNYKDVQEWLDRMYWTGIISEGTVYLAGQKKRVWAKDRFRIFDRAVSTGTELEPGKVADKNYVWLSEWQLENINNNYLLPVDLNSYRKLRNHIAKGLVPLLQIWLYASRKERSFEKRYAELCQILNIARYPHLSAAKRQLAPSLDELGHHAYLANWNIRKTTKSDGYKVTFFHGEKFFADRERRLSQREQVLVDRWLPETVQLAPTDTQGDVFSELTKRGIGARTARALLAHVPTGDEGHRLVEWADREIARTNPDNPAGFLIHLIRERITPPATFVSSRQLRVLQERSEEARRHAEKEAQLSLEYERYKVRRVEEHVESLPKGEYQQRVELKKKELLTKYELFARSPATTLQESAERSVRADVEKDLRLPSFEVFLRARDKNTP